MKIKYAQKVECLIVRRQEHTRLIAAELAAFCVLTEKTRTYMVNRNLGILARAVITVTSI